MCLGAPVQLQPRVCLDCLTELPEDLYDRFAALGLQARARGQHVRRSNGARGLQRADVAAVPRRPRGAAHAGETWLICCNDIVTKDQQDSRTACRGMVESTDLEAALPKLQIVMHAASEAACGEDGMDLEAAPPFPRRRRWLLWPAPTTLAKLVTSVSTAASALTGPAASADGMRCAKPMRVVDDMV